MPVIFYLFYFFSTFNNKMIIPSPNIIELIVSRVAV